jgi:hypothetical protein
MRSSRPISLFTEAPKESRKPSAFLVSILVHCTVVGVVIYGFLFAPRINMNAAADRYVLRDVDLNRPDLERKRRLADSGLYPGARPTEQTNTPHGSLAAPPSSLRQLERKLVADKTLIQPDTKINKLLLKTTPLPSLLLWASQKPKVQLITPPVKLKPVSAEVRPNIELPNQEVNLADIAISSTQYTKPTVMPVPSNTSPIAVHGLEKTETIPETSSVSSDQASSIAVMSLSEFRLNQGRVVLPPANQTAPGNPNGALAPGLSGNSSQAGKGDPSSRGVDAEARNGQGLHGNPSGPAGGKNGAGSGSAKSNSAQGAGSSGDMGGAPSFTRINVPHDGKFGVVIVGTALLQEYPQTGEFWGDRLVYSVYLHVGLSKNWILQYSLPASADTAEAGGVTHLEAPWPYYIVRPDVNPADVGADALMIHGFVDKAGHFESLALGFPPRFPKGQRILDELAQWQFRPATLNGQNARAEVLLIIPDED